MTLLKLAFYKGTGRIDDRIIRTATRSIYSHCELNIADAYLSASGRDGGVRRKQMQINPDHWDVLPLEGWERRDAWDRAFGEIGRPYDYAGIIFNFTVPIRQHMRQSWFCSELCAYALGFADPHTLAPGDLHNRVSEMNRAYLAGFEEGQTSKLSNPIEPTKGGKDLGSTV